MSALVKVNLGCGPGGIKGWVNFDWGLLPFLGKWPKLRKVFIKAGWLPKNYEMQWPPFKLVDIRRPLPLVPLSVDFVYCSQVLEHLEKYEAENVAKDVYQVLKPGGVFRVSVPDARKILKIYEKDKEADKLGHRIWGYEKQLVPRNWWDRYKRRFIRDHQWIYDEKSMSCLLKSAGFKEIEIVSFRKGRTPDIEKLDLEDHREASLYIEAIKQ